MSQGWFLAMAFKTLAEESRGARPLASGAKLGSSLSHPAGGLRSRMSANWAARSGNCALYLENSAFHCAFNCLPRLPIPAIWLEACRHIFVEGKIGIAFDGDVVAVVDPAQI